MVASLVCRQRAATVRERNELPILNIVLTPSRDRKGAICFACTSPPLWGRRPRPRPTVPSAFLNRGGKEWDEGGAGDGGDRAAHSEVLPMVGVKRAATVRERPGRSCACAVANEVS
jgi:hypothetical protein